MIMLGWMKVWVTKKLPFDPNTILEEGLVDPFPQILIDNNIMLKEGSVDPSHSPPL